MTNLPGTSLGVQQILTASSAQPASSTESSRPPVSGAPDAVGAAGWKLWNEQTAHRAIVDAIDGAKRVVNVEFFGFSDGGKGEFIVDALERAARRGVEVNVITDSISYFALPVGSFQRMRKRITAAGGHVITNMRVPLLDIGVDKPALTNVNHRKVVTVDGTNSFVGGINYIEIEDEYRDSMVQLSGLAAARLAAEQLDRWKRVGGAVTARHAQAVSQALGGAAMIPGKATDMRIAVNAPEQKRYELSDGYRDLIRNAKHRIWVSSPGYSDQELVAELEAAAKRGVDVRLVAPGAPPVGLPIINWVGRSHLKTLMAAGATAVEIPGVLHRKTLIADDEVIFSSFNITGRSKTYLHEIGVRTKDPEFVRAMERVLRGDMEGGTVLDAKKMGGFGDSVGDFIAQTLNVNY